uniref:Inhibitor_I29 domain-containing protein n=1 Tax=Anopheles merus TaxID=30066 RepID=A0A453Z1Y6_ANOME
MHIRHSHLILYLAVVGGFVVAGNFPPQRHSPSREEMRRARKQSQTAILQSVGKRSHGSRDALVSLSEELEMVAAAEATTVSSKKASPATVATPGNATAAAAAPVITTTTESDLFRSYMQTHRKKYYAKYRADRRRSALMENMQEIQEHNKAFEAGSNRFRMAPNTFADMVSALLRWQSIMLAQQRVPQAPGAVEDGPAPEGGAGGRGRDRQQQQRAAGGARLAREGLQNGTGQSKDLRFLLRLQRGVRHIGPANETHRPGGAGERAADGGLLHRERQLGLRRWFAAKHAKVSGTGGRGDARGGLSVHVFGKCGKPASAYGLVGKGGISKRGHHCI